MPIYCDESGGISAGAMVFAGVSIEAEAADHLLARFREVTALRGEMKGSRISLVERGLFFELLDRFGGRAIVAQAADAHAARSQSNGDLKTYVALLEDVVEAWLPDAGGCVEVIVDDGRYDPTTLGLVRAEIVALLGTCGRARLADSKRSAGVQIADVVANSVFNLAVRSERAERIRRILAPFLARQTIRLLSVA